MDFGLVEFVGGVGITGIGFIVKDAVLKTSIKHRIERLEEKVIEQEKTNKAQEGDLNMGTQQMTLLSNRFDNFEKNFEKFETNNRQDMKEVNDTLLEFTKAIAELNITMKNISGWLKGVQQSINQQRS